MTWKYGLSLVFVVVLAAAFFVLLPSYAGSSIKSPAPATDGKITDYPNGITKVEPSGFAISGKVSEMPASDPEAAAKVAAYKTRTQLQKLADEKLQKEKGYSEKEMEGLEINRQNAKLLKKSLKGAGAGGIQFEDSLVTRAVTLNGPQAMPTPILTFDGATSADNASQGVGGLAPPDPVGDVGPNHYISGVNSVIKIFNKNGTVAAGPVRTNTLFASLPPTDVCRTRNDGDPIVIYDSLADRWHISQFAAAGPFHQCTAISVTNDPTGAYYVYSYLYPGGVFNDYPKVGVWHDGYHMTFNQFNAAQTVFLGMGILTQDRQKALAGDPTASVVYTNIATIDPDAGGGLPADVDGIVPPPASMAQVIAEFRADEFGDPLDAIRYYKWVPNFTNPASSTISVLPDVEIAAFDARQPSGRGDIEQMGGSNLDSIADRLMHRFAYRNLGTQAAPVNSYTGSFTVNVSGAAPGGGLTAGTFQAGIRWFEMRRTGDAFFVFDQGTHNGPISGATGPNNWMSSIAQDNSGNIALGFSQSSTTQRANIMIAGRTNNVPNSGTLNEGEAVMFAAPGSQTGTHNRWGDYSSMNIDPSDECTFWYTQEYYAVNNGFSWSTRVGSFKFPGCIPAQKGTISGTITNCAGGAPLNLASVDIPGGYNRVTGAPGTYSMTVAPGSYTVTASKFGGFNTASAKATVGNGGTTTVNLCILGVPVIAAAGPVTLVAENALPPNSTPDPGETVTVLLLVLNNGGANTANLVGTLQATGGVTNPSGPQTYGVVNSGGSAVHRPFTFVASGTCGDTITLTLQLQDGATNLGTVTYQLRLGTTTPSSSATFANTGSISIPNAGAGTPYPSTINVTGVSGSTGTVSVKLNGFGHEFPDDVDVLLVSPTGQRMIIMSDAGGGTPAVNLNITLSDAAATALGDSTALATGSFRPANYEAGDTFPTPAPAGPYASPPIVGSATFASAFGGANPNGIWSLYVLDDAGGDLGNIAGGWELTVTPALNVCSTVPAASLSVSGRVLSASGKPISKAQVTLSGPGGTKFAMSSPFGYYRFQNIQSGSYTFTAVRKGYTFTPVNTNVNADLTGYNLTAQP